MRPWDEEPAGRFEELVFESQALRDNPLGDPHERPLWAYLPPGYDLEPDRRYAPVYVIQGLTGQLDMWRNRAAFRRNFPELADELFASGDAPPCIVVWVDCWTSLGGSQFLDSPGTGRYHTYLCDEVVPFVDEHYRTLATPQHRGIAGKSSGGYGAMVTPMLRPDLFGGLATHAGDALFETCYLPGFRISARTLRDEYDGSYERFWQDFRSRPAMSKDGDDELMNDWCMAACYSTDDDGTVRLPYDPATGELIPEVWERWLAWDPVRMAPWHALFGGCALSTSTRAARRVVPRPRRGGVPPRPGGDRRQGRLLRDLRRDPHGHRVPLPAVAQVPRRTAGAAPVAGASLTGSGTRGRARRRGPRP